jgi:hypothetical protein
VKRAVSKQQRRQQQQQQKKKRMGAMLDVSGMQDIWSCGGQGGETIYRQTDPGLLPGRGRGVWAGSGGFGGAAEVP